MNDRAAFYGWLFMGGIAGSIATGELTPFFAVFFIIAFIECGVAILTK